MGVKGKRVISVINNFSRFFLFAVILSFVKGYIFDGYGETIPLLLDFLIFPVVLTYILVTHVTQSFSWSKIKLLSILLIIYLFSECMNQLSYYFKTGVNIFNDVETGAVGMAVIFSQLFVSIIVISIKR